MDGHRLIAAIAVVFGVATGVACRGSSGTELVPEPSDSPDTMQPALRAALPGDWIALPALASAARTASASPGTRSLVAAWGDPGDGCYLLALEVYGHRRDRVRAVIDRLGKQLDAPAAMHAWEVPATDEVPVPVTAKLTVAGVTGEVRAQLATDTRALPRAALAACFHNDREPAACQAVCTRLLPLVQAPPLPQ